MRVVPLVLGVALAVVFQWRNGRVLRNNFLSRTETPFSAGYYALGDHNTKCEVVGDTTGELGFCEEGRFWDWFGPDGRLQERRFVLSCDPGRKSWNTIMGPLANPDGHGALWVSTTGTKNFQKITLEGYPNNKDFHPAGFDISPSQAGGLSNLFLINHGRRFPTVEHFTLSPSEPTRARWVRTIVSRYFISPNSLALTSPNSFYVTNDHLMTRRLWNILGKTLPLLETWLSLPLGWVSHVSIVNDLVPGSAVIFYSWPKFFVPFASGIAVSADGKQIAVASTSLGIVHFYSPSGKPEQKKKHDLKLTHSVPVPFLPDKVHFDDNGALIVAGHPSFFSLSTVANDSTKNVAPSWVVSIAPRTDDEPQLAAYDVRAPVSASIKAPATRSHEVETLFQSDGTRYSASSAGLRDSSTGQLFATSPYSSGVLLCHP